MKNRKESQQNEPQQSQSHNKKNEQGQNVPHLSEMQNRKELQQLMLQNRNADPDRGRYMVLEKAVVIFVECSTNPWTASALQPSK